MATGLEKVSGKSPPPDLSGWSKGINWTEVTDPSITERMEEEEGVEPLYVTAMWEQVLETKARCVLKK